MALGYLVAQAWAIIRPITIAPCLPLLYVEFFNFSNIYFVIVDGICIIAPFPDLEMFVVQHCLRNNRQPLGNIVKLDDVRQGIQLISKFRHQVPEEMTCNNSLELGGEFYVNSFADKEAVTRGPVVLLANCSTEVHLPLEQKWNMHW